MKKKGANWGVRPEYAERQFTMVDKRLRLDAGVRGMSPGARFLWVTLLTSHAMSSIPGLLHEHPEELASWCGLSPEGFQEAFSELSRAGRVVADWDAGVVWLPRAPRYRWPNGPLQVRGWRSVVRQYLPESPLVHRALFEIREQLQEVYEDPAPFIKAFDEAFPEAFWKPSTKPFPEPSEKGSPEKKDVRGERVEVRGETADSLSARVAGGGSEEVVASRFTQLSLGTHMTPVKPATEAGGAKGRVADGVKLPTSGVHVPGGHPGRAATPATEPAAHLVFFRRMVEVRSRCLPGVMPEYQPPKYARWYRDSTVCVMKHYRCTLYRAEDMLLESYEGFCCDPAVQRKGAPFNMFAAEGRWQQGLPTKGVQRADEAAESLREVWNSVMEPGPDGVRRFAEWGKPRPEEASLALTALQVRPLTEWRNLMQRMRASTRLAAGWPNGGRAGPKWLLTPGNAEKLLAGEWDDKGFNPALRCLVTCSGRKCHREAQAGAVDEKGLFTAGTALCDTHAPDFEAWAKREGVRLDVDEAELEASMARWQGLESPARQASA